MASSTSTIVDQEEQAKEKNIAEERNNRTITIPEDDYKWRKYGQKYIVKIKKFRCVNKSCKARKKVEWPRNEPNNIDITYEGDHYHRALAVGRSENEEAGILEDDYKWQKYGQKYIVSIHKNRSYFGCVNKNCQARKKVDWSPNEPNNIDIAYEGDHNHIAIAAAGRSENEEAGITANQYDLATQEQNIVVAFRNRLVVIPEDDYKWNKYGQMYIVSIQKNRSYFRCVNKNCKARKKVDWPPNEPNNIDITYEGDHNHRAKAVAGRSENEEAGITTNQYDLAKQEQNNAVAFSNGLVVIPVDDYKWEKYGQKYILSVQKNRFYFRCVNKNCKARKKVDWPPNEPNNIDITYEGDHNHRAIATAGHSENEEAGIIANQYDLVTQVFGPART